LVVQLFFFPQGKGIEVTIQFPAISERGLGILIPAA
jgi:hypothetical protein